MPTYQYLCRNCGHELEEFQSMSEPALTLCPACGTESLARVMGGGSAVIFKGTGFYLTDYKKSSSPPAAKKEGSDVTPAKSGSPEKK